MIIAGWWWFGQNQSGVAPTADNQPQTGIFFPVELIKNTVNKIITTTSNNIQEIIPGGQDEIGSDDQPIRQVVSQPVADYGFITYQGTSTLFYIEQNTGHIFALASGTPIRLSNKSIPRIQKVETAENSGRYFFYLNSLNEQNDLIWQKGELIKATSSELALTAMADNIKALAVSPKGDQVFVLKEVDGTSLGQIMNLNLEVPTTVFTSPFTEWVVEWVSDTKISFQTKPSSGVNGSIYLLDVKTKSFTPVVINIPGLIGKISSNSQNIIYTLNQNGLVQTFLSTNNRPSQIGISTLVDKCVWGNNNNFAICGVSKNISGNLNYPDSWYQGLTSFNDEIWVVTNRFENTILSGFGKNLTSQPIDIVNPKINYSKTLFYFQNKRDGSLWSFDLSTGFDL